MNDPGGAMIAIVAVVVTAAVVLAAGVRLGMLVAPRLSRWAERDADEEPGDPDPQP